jgi:hypothetical protein
VFWIFKQKCTPIHTGLVQPRSLAHSLARSDQSHPFIHSFNSFNSCSVRTEKIDLCSNCEESHKMNAMRVELGNLTIKSVRALVLLSFDTILISQLIDEGCLRYVELRVRMSWTKG